jgi:hypothetical protein
MVAMLALGQVACSDEDCDPCKASGTCPDPNTNTNTNQNTNAPPTLLTAQVDLMQLSQAVSTQQCEEWCWAASISMIFAFYGHPLGQSAIVAATYGAVACLPAGSSTTIGRDLSRPWIDDRGRAFSSQVVAAYDYFNRYNSLSNQMIVSALKGNNPLLYCNQSHAMVVYSVSYYDTPSGPNVQRVQVIDPWPFSPRSHDLSAAEMSVADLGGQMTFLAQVQVR